MAAGRRGTRTLSMLPAVAALATLFVVPPAAVKDDAFIGAQTTGILLIEAGECFSDPAYSASAGEPVVVYTPCAEGAANQSYGFVHAADGPWDRTALAAFAWRSCRTGFTRYWPGEAAEGLAFYPILPTAETWADGDRDVMCAVYTPGSLLRGSLLPLN